MAIIEYDVEGPGKYVAKFTMTEDPSVTTSEFVFELRHIPEKGSAQALVNIEFNSNYPTELSVHFETVNHDIVSFVLNLDYPLIVDKEYDLLIEHMCSGEDISKMTFVDYEMDKNYDIQIPFNVSFKKANHIELQYFDAAASLEKLSCDSSFSSGSKSSNSSDKNGEKKSPQTSIGLILGIVFSILGVIIIGGIATFFIIRYRRLNK